MRAFVALLILATASSARADVVGVDAYHYDIGVVGFQDLGFAGARADGLGFHIAEHNGFGSRIGALLIASPIMLLVALGDRDGKTSVTKSVSMGSVEVVNSKGDVVDRRTELIETTTFQTTPLSKSEQAANDKIQRDASSAAEHLMATPMHFDLTYLPDRDDGKLRGLRGSLYVASLRLGSAIELSIGYSGDRLKADVKDDDGTMRVALRRSRAIPLRIAIAPVAWAVFLAEWHGNLLSLVHDDSPTVDYRSAARASLAVSIPKFERVYVKAGVEVLGLSGAFDTSTSIEGGMRF